MLRPRRVDNAQQAADTGQQEDGRDGELNDLRDCVDRGGVLHVSATSGNGRSMTGSAVGDKSASSLS